MRGKKTACLITGNGVAAYNRPIIAGIAILSAAVFVFSQRHS
jgi:hypothetical protein